MLNSYVKQQHETAKDIATRKDLNEILTILNSSSNRSKKQSIKKREKQESGTSSKDSNSHRKEKKKVSCKNFNYCINFYFLFLI